MFSNVLFCSFYSAALKQMEEIIKYYKNNYQLILGNI